jgi:hypothetical protein
VAYLEREGLARNEASRIARIELGLDRRPLKDRLARLASVARVRRLGARALGR